MTDILLCISLSLVLLVQRLLCPRGGGKYFSRVTIPIPDLGHLDVGEAGTTIDRCIAQCPSHNEQWWTHVSGMFNLATFHAHAGGGAHHCHVGRSQVTQQCD